MNEKNNAFTHFVKYELANNLLSQAAIRNFIEKSKRID